MTEHIRNFCIIAHIDHGKSTLADRLLELTGTVSTRDMKSQLLDSMDLERERGITIKLTPVRMLYEIRNPKSEILKKSKNLNSKYILNLIDTPGHVDFNYEVSRSLAAVEGAILLVDATQGVQAQTIGNLYLAIEQNLTIIPVINKIDMPIANVEKTKAEIIHLLGCKEEDIILASAKTGVGVDEILEAVVERVPAPIDNTTAPMRALIFDSMYDDYRGVVAAVRIVDGELKKGEKIYLMTGDVAADTLEVGYYTPKFKAAPDLKNGEIGYIVTGLKEVRDCRVGDTIGLISHKQEYTSPLPGYKEVKPMVFAGVFPKEGDAYQDLRDAIDRLKLSDSSLTYDPESSQALGFGFRCGFLGMLHLDIFQERLKREFDIELIITVPSVAYKIVKTNGDEFTIHSPQEMIDPGHIKEISEPWMTLDVITPKDYVGNVMALVTERKGEYVNTEYLSAGSDQRAVLHYKIPLAALVTDFYDKLKTVTSGYASMNYEYIGYKPTDVVKMDILVADEPVEALSILAWRDEAYHVGKKIVESLKESLPKQQFVVKIQAAIGGKIIASERLSALRKDVLAKMSGGDYTRKLKLLQKQKKGKKRMLSHGKIDIPAETYLAVLKR
ncbi:MAG: Elongation factor 4 [Candidatus Magasanikbacteria bacterium GW2011_GWA2_37_8]|uniref:Elongation factor 4 n=1 Tax=Candidatus Magasanikbacteria bacterium GW2011_GWA2_37_8 TaxID=1619036 RepID=A0A0G0JTK3_9BACT|nr:MAG: Elongation factor 4 [Candidatus Magasanikbacteria bacterium GW2011_GWA2_37_8]